MKIGRKDMQVWVGVAIQVSGLVLTINESLMHGLERPSLYVLWAGMMGLPLVWDRTVTAKKK